MAKEQPSKETSERIPIEKLFLREFIRQTIINSKPKSSIDKNIIERVRARMAIVDIPKPSVPTKRIEESPKPKMPLQQRPLPRPMPQQRFQQRPSTQTQQRPPIQQRPPQTPQKPAQQKTEPRKEEKEDINLGKLQQFMKDARVTGVECPGPGKNILVNRSGLVQAVPLTLTSEEIDFILNDFSHKTKIPLTSGVFKALYNNLLITAIVSEMAGNRFILEKHFGKPSLPKKEDVK